MPETAAPIRLRLSCKHVVIYLSTVAGIETKGLTVECEECGALSVVERFYEVEPWRWKRRLRQRRPLWLLDESGEHELVPNPGA